MTEQEARAIMKAHKWTYHVHHRRSLGTKYVYAQRRLPKRKKLERYICPLSRLGELTEEQLTAKLMQPPPAEKS